MKLKKLTDDKLIILDSKNISKNEIISNLAELLFDEKRINSKQDFLNDIYERENEVSTSMGFDVAIPHCRSKSVLATSLVFIRLENTVQWDDDEVKLVFCIAVPEKNSDNEHLKIISSIARKLIKKDYRDILLELNDKQKILKILQIK
jgi:fructose-specific phosphotransferase system IIA component